MGGGATCSRGLEVQRRRVLWACLAKNQMNRNSSTRTKENQYYDSKCVDVLERLREMNLMKKEDIQEYSIDRGCFLLGSQQEKI